MGIFLKVAGVISLIIGIIFAVTILGLGTGISLIIDGVVLFALGSIYDNVNDIKKKIG